MGRKRGRYVAPIALLAVLVAIALVVNAGLSDKHHSTAAADGHHRSAAPTRRGRSPRKVFYVVQAGDTLSTISAHTGISVPTLETLNPTVDPNALQTGQRLRLRR